MKFLLIALLSINACMSATVHRDEWLACCKLCDNPRNMDYVVKSVYDAAEVLCHCKNMKEFLIYDDN